MHRNWKLDLVLIIALTILAILLISAIFYEVYSNKHSVENRQIIHKAIVTDMYSSMSSKTIIYHVTVKYNGKDEDYYIDSDEYRQIKDFKGINPNNPRLIVDLMVRDGNVDCIALSNNSLN